MGKTQVALEYAHRFAENPELVAGQLTALAVSLGLVSEHAEAEALAALRVHLQQQVRWLLVFDNAETVAAMQPWLPAGVGHVLVTSRCRDWHEFASVVALEPFNRRESLTLLRERVPDLPECDADRIADQLGDLPLALVQAATVLAGGMPAMNTADQAGL